MMTKEEAEKLFSDLLRRIRADYDDPGYVTLTTETWFVERMTQKEARHG